MPDDHLPWLESLAESIARAAHLGQTDRSGADHIDHPARVAAAVTGSDAKAVAWLHDVVEDTSWSLEDLLAAGVPDRVAEAVDALTRRPGEARADHLARVRAHPLARTVKLADLADNASPQRMAGLDEGTRRRVAARYDEAVQALTA